MGHYEIFEDISLKVDSLKTHKTEWRLSVNIVLHLII